MERIPLGKADPCNCRFRPNWAPIENETVMHWQAIDIGEWEEIRVCPDCQQTWLTAWPLEGEAPPILCKILPERTKKLKELDRVATYRSYCLSKLEEHLGTIQEQRQDCRKVSCRRKRIVGTSYCIEHLIAERFGRQFAALGSPDETLDEIT